MSLRLRWALFLAVKDFLQQRENRRILKQLNRVYGEEQDEGERNLAKAMKGRLRRLTDREEW